MPTYILICTAASTCPGKYLQGPKPPAHVKKLGYKFDLDRSGAWPFPSEKQAVNKARIICRHMSWPVNAVAIEPQP